MKLWERLPESVTVGGKKYRVDLDFRNVLHMMDIMADDTLTPEARAWDSSLVHLARYGIWRYWLQAVSDFDLVGRVKFILASCLVIKWLGGDLLVTAQRYSKEIENDADNVDALLDAAYTAPAMADIRLLGLLLEE